MVQLQLCSLSAWKVGDRAYLTAIVEGRDYAAYILSEAGATSGHGYRSVGEARGGLCEYMEEVLGTVKD